MVKVRKEFEMLYLDAAEDNLPHRNKLEVEIEDQCPFCRAEGTLIPMTGASSIADFTSYYDLYDSYAITTCRNCSASILHFLKFYDDESDPHFIEEMIYPSAAVNSTLLSKKKSKQFTSNSLSYRTEETDEKKIHLYSRLCIF